ncbi:MAG: hypothetical protein SGPRY_002934 [Prymnesium sp.]
MEDLSALSFTSALGCLAVAYTACFIAFRALDGSYTLPSAEVTGGRLLATIAKGLEPSFKLRSLWRLDAKVLVLCSNLGLAYIAHYNAPAFYRTLDRKSPERWATVVGCAFSVLALLYTSIMLLGYSTFGDHCASNILRNYAQSDVFALLGRLATALSLIFGYPLAMVGLRDSSVSILESFANSRSRMVITLIAVLLSDIGNVVGVSGALLGAVSFLIIFSPFVFRSIVYIFPTLIYSKVKRKKLLSPVNLLIPLGATLALLGVWQTLK